MSLSTTDSPPAPLHWNPSKQSGAQQLEPQLDRAYAPHPDFRSRPSTQEEEHFRHSGWAARRRLIWAALQRLHLPTSRLDRFAECGAGVFIGIDAGSGEMCLTCNRCRDRWCIPCGTENARRISDALVIAMDARRCRFITLTRRHTSTPLKDQLASLHACFRRLRDRGWWRSCVEGGAYFTELKLSDKTGQWHVHLHLITTGSYVDQKRLSEEWLAVTQDSSIVDVRMVADGEHVARYVCKYVTKPADASVYAQPARLDEMITALRGAKLCGTWGTWRGVQLTDDTEPPRQIVEQRALSNLLADVRRGDPDAYSLWRSALLRWPSLACFDRTPDG